MDRRTFLVLAAAAAGTAGCTGTEDRPGPTGSTPAPPDPDDAIRVRVAESEAALIATYRAALDSAPALARTLVPLLRQHEEHLGLVAPPGWTPPVTSATGPSGSSGSSGSSGGPAPAASPALSPAPADALLVELAAAETAARDQRITACDGATDPDLARLLCLVGASEAQHAAVLERAVEDLG